MAQHECVARFYDEHTQDVCNSAGPSTVDGAMKLARRLLDDGCELSKDYEKLQAENKRLERQFADIDAIPLSRFAGVVAMLESIKDENKRFWDALEMAYAESHHLGQIVTQHATKVAREIVSASIHERALAVQCPTCGVISGPCRTSGGNRAQLCHVSRVAVLVRQGPYDG